MLTSSLSRRALLVFGEELVVPGLQYVVRTGSVDPS
jgi:hypothetical protein